MSFLFSRNCYLVVIRVYVSMACRPQKGQALPQVSFICAVF